MVVGSIDTLADIEAALEKLSREIDVDALDANGARVLLRRSVAIKRFAESLEILAAQRVASTGTWVTSGHRSIGSFLAATAGTPVGAGNKLAETAAQVAASAVGCAVRREARRGRQRCRRRTRQGCASGRHRRT